MVARDAMSLLICREMKATAFALKELTVWYVGWMWIQLNSRNLLSCERLEVTWRQWGQGWEYSEKAAGQL